MPLLPLLVVVVQVKVACVAPSVRVAVSEEFGLEPGQVSIGQLVAGLRALGFDKVFDTNFTADLTVRPIGRQAARTEDGHCIRAGLRWTSVLCVVFRPSLPDHGGGLGAAGSSGQGQGGRSAAHVHVVLPRLGEPGGEVLPAAHPTPLHRQVAARYYHHRGRTGPRQTRGKAS